MTLFHRITRALLAGLMGGSLLSGWAAEPLVLERVSTVAAYPRGLVMRGSSLVVLSRGRPRDVGGVTALVTDHAGTLYLVDPLIAEPFSDRPVGDAIRRNGRLLATPSEPPFQLWQTQANPPASDRLTDRPYCTLSYHAPSQNLFICAFSGVDLPAQPGSPSFSKNFTDALMRYDLRTRRWYSVERHRAEAGARYPHHDPASNPPPHGWLAGPNNCQTMGHWLYAVGKDNNRLVRYDLREIIANPEAGPPASAVVLDERVTVRGLGEQTYYGQSMMAWHDGWFYLGYRTSSVIIRFRLDADYLPVQPLQAELVARFDPYDPQTLKSANLTDMAFDAQGRLYVISASPARLYRFKPDPAQVFDGRTGQQAPWADLAAMTRNPEMKSENVMIHAGYAFVSSGDTHEFQNGAGGTLYRLRIPD